MPPKKDHIKELEEQLYSKTNERMAQMRPHELSEKDASVQRDWREDEPPRRIDPEIFEESGGGPGKIFWLLLASIVFFVGAASYAGYSLLKGEGAVSPQNINVEISGPVSTPGGEKLSLDVVVTNKNKAMLRVTELVIEYPKGTRKADDISADLNNERIYLGDIEPGQTVRTNLNAILFGEENSAADIKMNLEYRIPNSNSIFTKEAPYQITISSNPLSLSVDSPQETVSGENMTIRATVRSNANETIKNVLLEVQYPAGFVFKEASLKPSLGNNVWQLGDLPAGQEREIKIIGILSGENEDARTFRFSSGVARSDNENAIENPFAGYKNQVAIKKPFLALSMKINGQDGNEVALAPGEDAQIEVTYDNNLPVPVRNISISLGLSGSGLNKQSVKVNQGFYQSGSNTIIFDKSGIAKLAEVSPGESGTVTFSLKPEAPAGVSNPSLTISGSVSGDRFEESGVPEAVRSAAEKRILVKSNISLSGKVTYYTGAFQNSGGLPPKAEKETTYSVFWSLSNTSNDISDVKVTATLPPYMRFTGEISPTSEKVSYNEAERQVTWDVGILRAGVGYNRASRSVSFKVGLTPSVSQVGQEAVLVNPADFAGIDSFTKTSLSDSLESLTTRISDAQVKSGDETVIP